MGKDGSYLASEVFGSMGTFLRRCIFRVLSIGPIPSHLAFIMDGNRRFAKKNELKEGAGHEDGFLVLMSLLKYCYDLGVKYVTVYAFSIHNFRRRPNEVKSVMDLMLEKIEGLLKEESLVNRFGVRVCDGGPSPFLLHYSEDSSFGPSPFKPHHNPAPDLLLSIYMLIHAIFVINPDINPVLKIIDESKIEPNPFEPGRTDGFINVLFRSW